MTSIVTDFKSINRKLNRMEQKAELVAAMPFNEAVVSQGVELLRGFADDRLLGAPTKIYLADEMYGAGVACEWPNEIRNAVCFKNSADAAEAARRLKAWSAQRG